jgi:hypothetical protein
MKNYTGFMLLFFIFSIPLIYTQSKDYVSVTSDVKYQYIGTYDIERLNKILTTERNDFKEYDITYPSPQYQVKLYRVIYTSVVPEKNNKPTTASGLIGIPETGNSTMPVVSYQHGTIFTKTEVPSNPEESYETRIQVAQFAGNGYIFIGADYFGKGISEESDGYVVKGSTQQACYDMYIAAKYVTNALGVNMSDLFLTGWSQGGYNTVAFLNKLEDCGVKVKAAAIASAPVDLLATLNKWIHNYSPDDAIYLPGCINLILNSYQEYYNVPVIQFAVKPEYQQYARDFYFNKISWEEFSKNTPVKTQDFLTEEFMNASSLGRERFFLIAQENQSYRWRSITPMHTYYGDIDEVVRENITTLPVGYQKIVNGSVVTGVPAGSKADHRGTFLFSVLDSKKWFDELLTGKTLN